MGSRLRSVLSALSEEALNESQQRNWCPVNESSAGVPQTGAATLTSNNDAVFALAYQDSSILVITLPSTGTLVFTEENVSLLCS